MYRYNVDNAITYTEDDLVLFRESPFAVWMERLTLENPDHGIPPDLGSIEPGDKSGQQDDIVATLRAEGRNVALIERELDEPCRRTATLGAMRDGADFIVSGQLALGNLSGCANLLMRTSGYSDLGDFLYIPCETQSRNTFQSAFRLCFAADLLLGLQGQLPPQMLIIRDGAEVVPLQTEDYIYYYQAVQLRFMQAMSSFRKHRMPDPAESSHFGRWSECACEVLRQRAHSEQQRTEEHQSEEAQAEQMDVVEIPQLRVAGSSGTIDSHYDPTVLETSGNNLTNPTDAAVLQATTRGRGDSGATLAEQARLLTPDSFRSDAAPGHTPNLARFGRARAIAAVPDNRDAQHNRRSTDAALQNLEFIGSSTAVTRSEVESLSRPLEEIQASDGPRPAPAPNLRETPRKERPADDLSAIPVSPRLTDLQPRAPIFLPPDKAPTFEPSSERPKLQPRPVEGSRQSSVIDLDSAPPPTLAPVVQRAEEEFERFVQQNPAFRKTELARPKAPPEEQSSAASPFSSSLITSPDFDDR